ncbi:ATP synthase F0 sector subunit b' [hydrothermal vent metagenome]|uniref:ATP synthase F0 sector subunit b n=1 Tax=hydrothermal vent metagenome TaxID=652676 RepID=A0A1W1BSN8_9ZZZZ
MLDINPLLLFSTLVVFLILIAVLNSWLYRPLLAFMQKRDEDIKLDLSKAGSNDSEIKELLEKAESIVMNAKLEAAALREKVIADAKELAQSRIEAKKAALASEYLEFEKSLEEKKEELKKELLADVPTYKDALKLKFSQI